MSKPPVFNIKKKKFLLKIFSLTAIVAVFYLVYYLLLHDNLLHASISSIIGFSHQMALKRHLFVLSLLPIYIAIVIFGAGMLSVYLALRLERFFIRTMHKQTLFKKKQKLRNLPNYL